MNAIVPQEFKNGAISTVFAGVKPENDLGAGIQQGFGHIGYKGKVWSIRYRGQEIPLMRDDGDGPRGSIEVIILKSSTAISKIWYENGYIEGSNAAPDCFSGNGLHPDPASAKKQSVACASCPKNAWGSRITPEGKKGKACSDSKRLAIVPMNDISNEAFGGPMLLRVPAASLNDLAAYGDKMMKLGYPYYAIATRIAFDSASAYPKFIFGAIRQLTDAEAKQVIDMRSDPRIERVLAVQDFEVEAPQLAPPAEQVFEQPPQAKTQTVAPPQTQTVAPPPTTAGGFGPTASVAPPQAAAPAAPAAPKAEPKPAPKSEVSTAFEASLDDRLKNLLG